MLLLWGVAGLFSARPRQPLALVSPAVPAASPAATPADECRSALLPLVARAAAEASELVALGERKERNLFTLRDAQQAMEASLAPVDTWLAAHPPPAACAAAAAAYTEGAAMVRAAMDEAWAGFLRLDFGRVARAVATMRAGEGALRRAVSILSGEAPTATPGAAG
jgi:hypothetical protein